jgi:hypothetical protein
MAKGENVYAISIEQHAFSLIPDLNKAFRPENTDQFPQSNFLGS